jgi:putative ABC transport system permease protein
MKLLPFVLRSALRKKARVALTLLSIAVAAFLYGLLATLDASFQPGAAAAGADRLFVRNKTSFILPLPYSYGTKIARVPGVAALTYSTWFGGVYRDQKSFFPQIAIDTATYFSVYPDLLVSKDEMAAFLADRQGCIVGRGLLERFGWKVGDRVPIQGTIYPGTWELTIRGVFDRARPQEDTSLLLFRHDYLEERRRSTPSVTGSGVVGWYMARLADPASAVTVGKQIDETFANSAYETSSEPEKMGMSGALAQMGNVRFMLLSVGVIVLFTLLLVTGSTMAASVRERTSELAVLKTIGFGDGHVLGLVLAESAGIAVTGGAVGLSLAKLLTLVGDPTKGMLAVFHLSVGRLAVGFAASALVGLASGAIPAVLAMRLRIVDAFRRV